jgi:hypothetical protein
VGEAGAVDNNEEVRGGEYGYMMRAVSASECECECKCDGRGCGTYTHNNKRLSIELEPPWLPGCAVECTVFADVGGPALRASYI